MIVDEGGRSVSILDDTLAVGPSSVQVPESVKVFRAPANADLWISNTDGVGYAVPGQPLTYTVVATNAGLAAVVGAVATDNMPAALTGVTWTCAASTGSACSASGSGSINDAVTLLVGGNVTYTVTAVVDPAATGSLANTATIAVPAGGTDPVPVNNSATDTDPLSPRPIFPWCSRSLRIL